MKVNQKLLSDSRVQGLGKTLQASSIMAAALVEQVGQQNLSAFVCERVCIGHGISARISQNAGPKAHASKCPECVLLSAGSRATRCRSPQHVPCSVSLHAGATLGAQLQWKRYE
eukprot:1158842-Pelagomonas_calceolata.AAC.10